MEILPLVFGTGHGIPGTSRQPSLRIPQEKKKKKRKVVYPRN